VNVGLVALSDIVPEVRSSTSQRPGIVGSSFSTRPHDDPSLLSIRAQADYVGTEFLDDLYVKSRGSVLGVVGIDGEFQ